MRPIMGTTHGPNTGLTQIGCRIIRAIIEDCLENHDVKSTEELLESLTSYDKSLKNKRPTKKKVAASMDICSFYHSNNPIRAAEFARMMWSEFWTERLCVQ